MATALRTWSLLLLSLFLAANLQPANAGKAAPPQVTLATGTTLNGIADTKNGIAVWKGVRYAQAPLGKLRFAPPQPIDEVTQGSQPATSKAKPKSTKGVGGQNAAIGLRPLPVLGDAWAWSRGFANSTYQSTVAALNRTLLTPRASASVVDATSYGPKCSQVGKVEEQSDDCLYINVWRPLDAPSQPLPVLLFIHGGGWQTGAGSDYDPTFIMNAGSANGQPVVVVTFNYRLNIFGFLSSSDLANLAGLDPSGCSGARDRCETEDVGSEPVGINLGYQDTKMAIKWVSANIASFGGDPSKITLWGQSAGAFSIGAQLLGHPGSPITSVPKTTSNPPRPLFRGAILHSGAASGASMALPSDRDLTWNLTLSRTGCNAQTAQARVDCLRGLDWNVLRNESIRLSAEFAFDTPGPYLLGSYPWSPVIDGGSQRGAFFDRAANKIVAQGNFAKVPLIAGNCQDEGTIFAPHQFTTEDQFSSWVRQVHFATGNLTVDNAVYATIATAYPNNPAVGSPFTPTSHNLTDRFYAGADNQYKRAAALYGDIRFQSNRRYLLQSGLQTGTTPAAWSFAFSDPPPKAPVSHGVAHGTDLDALFGNRNSPIDAIMARQWVSFAYSLDPTAAGGNLPAWPKYDLTGRTLMNYVNGKTELIKDNYRDTAMDALNSPQVLAVTNR